MSVTATAANIKQTFPCELTTMQCGECGGIYAINERYRRDKHEEGSGWTCPYCKCNWGYFGNGLNEQLKKDIEHKQQQIERQIAAHDQTKADLRETERRRRAEKGAKTRLKNRIHSGTCPCCDQSFADLATHMAELHPDFAVSANHDEPTEQE